MRRRKNTWKGLAAGAAGGFAATVAMSQFQKLWSAVQSKIEKNSGNGGGDQKHSDEPATVKAAEALSTNFAGHHLTKSEKKKAGPAVHYAFGTANGMLYGAVSEHMPKSRLGYGSVFGAGLWAVADEFLVPAFGFSKPVAEYPASTHLYGLVSHLVYGVVTDRVSRGIRALV
jgi:putative membrane protein